MKPSGTVHVQVFSDAASFKAMEDAVAGLKVDPDPAGIVATMLSLDPGRYAIAIFQDTNGSGKLETNMLGKPTVPYGFSNNAGGRTGPPAFDDAAFDVGADGAAQAIALK